MSTKESTEFKKSSYNIVIPLSSQITQSHNPLYIVSNPVYGLASLIDEKEYTVLTEFPHISEDSIVSSLKEAGYITCLTEEEETALLQTRYEARKNPSDPRAALVVTYQCNLRCTYCWTDHLFAQNTQWVNTVIDKKAVDAAFSTIPKIDALESLKIMSLYGGEPFLPSTFSIVEYILKRGSKRDYMFHANTNGVYLKVFTPLLVQHNISGLGVTLDGIPAVHDARRKKIDGSGTFAQIREGIDTALDAGISIGVRINVDGENFSKLPLFADWIGEHGWADRRDITFAITPVRPGVGTTPLSFLTYPEMGKKIIELMKEHPSLLHIMYYSWEYTHRGYLTRTIMDGSELQPRPFYCSAHCQGFAFDPFGDIYSCPRAVGDKRFSIGQYIPDLQFGETYNQWFNRDVLSIPKCRECNLALVCGGGCAYEAYLEHKTIYEGHCERYKAFVEYGLPILVRRRMMRGRHT